MKTWFNNLKTGYKLALGFGLCMVLMLVMAFAAYRASRLSLETAAAVARVVRVIDNLDGARGLAADIEADQRGYIITGEDKYMEGTPKKIADLEQHLNELGTLIVEPDQKRRFDRLASLIARRLVLLKQGEDLRRTQGFAAAQKQVQSGEGLKAMDAVDAALQELRDEEDALLRPRETEAAASVTTLYWTLGLTAFLGVAMVLFIGVFISRSITCPLRELTGVAERIRLGDLAFDVSSAGRTDEVGALAQSFGRMTESFQTMAAAAEQVAGGDLRVLIQPQSAADVLGNALARMTEALRQQVLRIQQGVNALVSSASEIATSVTQVTSGAQETATAVTQTTATVEQVKQGAHLTSQKSKEVAESAKQGLQTAHTGRKATETVAEGMTRINVQMASIADTIMKLGEQSQAIGEIISTVDDIAEQSNLLAVNAAVEAAKAGDHGKGFAVVAQ
ncbi:MAG: methyl-accepting chemotaxis protein, partial [Pirellulales bacterium]